MTNKHPVHPDNTGKSYKKKPTERMKRVLVRVSKNGGKGLGRALKEEGYSDAIIKTPAKVKNTKSWDQLMDEFLPPELVALRNNELLNATHLQHDTFATGPRNEVEKKKFIEELERQYVKAKDEKPEVEEDEDDELDEEGELKPKKKKKAIKKGKTKIEIQKDLRYKIELAKETLTDTEIIQMLKEVGCTVKRIAHRDYCREVYYWTADNRARKDALEMAHKLRGNYAPDKHDVAVSVLPITGMKISIEKDK